MSASNEEQSQDGDWGWEPLGSEDEEPPNTQGVIINTKHDTESMDADAKAISMGRRLSSEKSLSAKRGSFTGQKTLPGIVSSPSFLELEKAIGATLNLASNDSGDLSEARLQSPTSTTTGTFPASKLSSTNLTQQKINQQRLRQQQQHNQRYSSQTQHNRSPAAQSYPYSNPPSGYAMMPPALQPLTAPARAELAPYINESESRAIILFHSVHISTADIRNACSKYGVLYYIRPEFHSKGVTLISYFDLRAASSAKACIVEDLGRGADASVHYSVMLHAANGNSEEFRLVVRNLPAESCAEADVQAIFARYGQLRSIQKTFEEGSSSPPRSLSSDKTAGDDRVSSASASGPRRSTPDASASSPKSTEDQVDATEEESANCKIAYSIEYYNIQDARLAASELSATSAQLWNTDVTVKFAPLDERKQQLCRQLLATLSRWRTEMATMATSAAALSYNFNMQHQQQQLQVRQQQQQQLGMASMGLGYSLTAQQQGLGLGLGGLSMGLPMAMTQQSSLDGGASYFDPTNPFYQQQVYMQHQAQQQQRFLASTNGSAVDQSGLPMPMSVQAMAGLMYAPGAADGLGGVSRVNPMQSLMPANLSNPNLFNLGLLAAQAEAQMQQQQQQHMLMHQHQQLQQQQEVHGVGAAGAALGNGSNDAQNEGSGDIAAVQRPGSQQFSQGTHIQGQQQGFGGRYGPQSTTGNSMRMHNGGRGGNVPPHHQNSGAYALTSYGGMASPANMTTGGLNAPLHHHQQHHLQMQQHAYNVGGQQGSVGGSHSQQLARRGGGKVAQATGQYAYSAFPPANGGGRGDSQQDADFALDLKRIGDDVETRTTVMVRNIPNKYNQQMLLEEVNVGHEGTYDFFYLPIDFKNRCNVGYCFINFLDPKHIPPFVHAFNGQRWKSFNSEKVCAVTFARIQGKQAMISRFQNSSLLEKDDEYQPLLFFSTGPDRGKPEPFPVSSNARRTLQQQQPPSVPAGGAYYHPGSSQSPPPPSVASASSSRSTTPPPPPASATPRSSLQQQLHAHHHTGHFSHVSGNSADQTETVPQEVGAA